MTSLIGSVIQDLKDISLIFKSPNGRRYSSSLLAMAITLQKMSPSCYKQLYEGGFLTLPCHIHLRPLSTAIDMDTLRLSASTVAYLKARFRKLKDREKVVSILMDEM